MITCGLCKHDFKAVDTELADSEGSSIIVCKCCFIKHFFGCRECEMTKSRDYEKEGGICSSCVTLRDSKTGVNS